MASGNLGLITFPREPGRVTLEQLAERRPGLIDALRAHPGIGVRAGALRAPRAGRARPRGQRLLRDDTVEGEDPLAPFGPYAADHVRRTDAFPHCPDIMVNSTYWEELEEVAAFEELVGSHGGHRRRPGAPVRAAPGDLPWPDGAGRRRGRPCTASCAAGSRRSARTPTPTPSAAGSPGASTRRASPGASSHARRGERARRVDVSSAAVSGGRARSGRKVPQWIGIAIRGRDQRDDARRAARGRGGRDRVTGPSPRSGSARTSTSPRSALHARGRGRCRPRTRRRRSRSRACRARADAGRGGGARRARRDARARSRRRDGHDVARARPRATVPKPIASSSVAAPAGSTAVVPGRARRRSDGRSRWSWCRCEISTASSVPGAAGAGDAGGCRCATPPAQHRVGEQPRAAGSRAGPSRGRAM